MRERTIWTQKELDELAQLVKEGKSREELMEHFDRSKNAIEVKVNRLGLQLTRPHKRWKKKELADFKEDWQDTKYTMQGLTKKYGRSKFSLRKKALELDLGARPYNEEYLSISTICEEMQVSVDRVANWIKLGLPTTKNKSGKTRYLIDVDDLLEFLEWHQDMFNASLISDYLFLDEPEWLKEKRIKDTEFYPTKFRLEWTNEMDKQLVSMFKVGKSNEEMAKFFHKTSGAVSDRLRILNLFRGRYNDYEIEILNKYHDSHTLDELAKMLPLRSVKGIAYKCEQLGLSYHFSKSKCNSVEE